MSERSASTRYRALQYVPALERRFDTVTISTAEDSVPRLPGRWGQLRYFARHARNYLCRYPAVRAIARESDFLLVQRGLYPLGPAALVEALDGFRGRIVFDLDDAVFRTSPMLSTKGRVARWLYGPQQALAILRRADAVVVSTEELATQLPPGSPAPVVIPSVPDPRGYPTVRHGPRQYVTIGWAGSVGSLSYLDPLAEIFVRLTGRDQIRVEVVCSHPWSGPAEFRPWRIEEEASLFLRFDIGIMPLPYTPYTRAKAGFKLLQYMAAGLPVVASPVGVNRELVERADAGFLAETPAEWEEALRTLAEDGGLRARLGANGRRFIEGYADVEAIANQLENLLRGA